MSALYILTKGEKTTTSLFLLRLYIILADILTGSIIWQIWLSGLGCAISIVASTVIWWVKFSNLNLLHFLFPFFFRWLVLCYTSRTYFVNCNLYQRTKLPLQREQCYPFCVSICMLYHTRECYYFFMFFFFSFPICWIDDVGKAMLRF